MIFKLIFKQYFIVVIVGLSSIILTNCGKRPRYERMVAKGLESGIRKDSILLGLSFGMTSQEFYNHCWDLNQKGIVHAGIGNKTVLYKTSNGFDSEVNINFYPEFFEDKIVAMPVTYKYDAWAPWNKKYSKDSLFLNVLDNYRRWYGNDFLEINHATKGPAFVKIDGNKRISIYKTENADGVVSVLFTDMSVEKAQKKENLGGSNEN